MIARTTERHQRQPSRFFNVSSARRLDKKNQNNWQEKAWGWTRPITESSERSLHELRVEEGGYCSIHIHEYRTNIFYVQDGKISVAWLNQGRWSERFLTPSKKLEIPAGVPHLFKVWESGSVFEEYLPANGGPVRNSDIKRFREGGKVSVADLATIPGYPVPETLL